MVYRRQDVEIISSKRLKNTFMLACGIFLGNFCALGRAFDSERTEQRFIAQL